MDPRDEAPDDPDHDRERDRGELPDSLRQRLEAMVPELVKRTFAAGMGAVFSTEEGIRKLAKDINIPDVAGYIATTADTTKDKVLDVVAREVREFLQTMNLGEEVAKLLTTLSFEVKTEIRFIPNSERYGGVEPDVKGSVRLKRAGSSGDKDKDKADRGDKDKDGDDEQRRGLRRFWRRDEGDEGDDDGGGGGERG
ncbi:MAG: hypothetical protein H6709_16805 [Kofleriaceae bacterium]|nr:hypothetical protein [Myxococcales bacterium]MCB9561710.1 hypothetical protein [Kofleriaceae bacterium]MCB9573741.1 hypothetical protein [Kofleriaceae bacterium]